MENSYPYGTYVEICIMGPDGEQWVIMRAINSVTDERGLWWIKVEYEYEDPRCKFWYPQALVRKAKFDRHTLRLEDENLVPDSESI